VAHAAGRFGRLLVSDLAGAALATRAALEPLERLFLTTAYRATILADLGRLSDAVALAEELRPLVFSDRRVEAGAYHLARVTALIHQGRFGEALRACDQADTGLAEQRAGIDPYDRAMGEAGSLFSRAIALAFRGHPRWQAEQARLLAAADAFDLDFARMTARVVMSVACSVRGDRPAAQQTLQAYLDHYRTLGRAAHAYRVYPWIALCELEGGHLAAARAHIETYRQSAPAGYFREGLGAYLEGELLLAAGDGAAAEARLSQALGWARDRAAASVLLESRSRLGLGEVALLGDRPDEAAGHAQRVLELSGAAATRCERDRIRARRLLGRAHQARGDVAGARPELDAALLLCHAADSPLEWALSHAALAALARQAGVWSDEAGHRREAERRFQSLGHEVLARRLRPGPAAGRVLVDPPPTTGDEGLEGATRADRPRRRHPSR
jgi:tetratricopeptide (TPR) repeat protein